MCSLVDLELKHIFHAKKIDDDGVPLFAMSENGKLLAASHFRIVVIISLIENSSTITSYSIHKNDHSTETILDMKFFDDNNKLVILTQEIHIIHTSLI